MGNKLILTMLVCLLLVSTVSALDLKDVAPKQIDKTQVLDETYIVKDDGTYFKDLRQIDPVVWVDKKVGTTYHIDSQKTFIENETITLKLKYEVQPDWIAHYTHSGEFDRYYFPTQWTWTANCPGGICDGGWVTLEIENIEKGAGSSTLPIGITGPTWAHDGQFAGEFDGVTSIVAPPNLNLNSNNVSSISSWVKINSGKDASQRAVHLSKSGTTFSLRISTTEKPACSIENSTDSEISLSATDELDLNTWIYINCVTNRTNLFIYLNGVLEDSVFIGAFNRTEDLNLGIGSINPVFSAQSFNGSIDEVLIYNRTLEQAEITGLFANYTVTENGIERDLDGGILTNGLVLNINFDDYSVADTSGEQNHGVNTNVSFVEVVENQQALTENIDYNITDDQFRVADQNLAFTQFRLSYNFNVLGTAKSAINKTEFGLGTFADFWSIIVLAVVIAVVIGLLISIFGSRTGGRR